MGLTGNLRTMDLPEILQWVSLGHKTGTLHLERGSIEKRISFREGGIYTSWSNDPRESLGQYLIRHHRLSEEQLFRAMLRQEERAQPLGTVLLDEGLLEEEDLRGLLEQKAQETVYDVFLWPEGRFEFVDGELPEAGLVFLDLDVTHVVLEGARRMDEWRRIRKVIPSAHTTFSVAAGEAPAAHSVAAERALRLAAAGKTVAEIGLELRRSEFEAAALLFELQQAGAVAVVGDAAPEREADPVAATRELLAEGYARLSERRYLEALEAYDSVLALDPLNQHAKKGRQAAEQARARVRAARTVPLDGVPVLSVGLGELTGMNIDPQEGFVLSRVNGQWDVRSILKLCPIPEEEALQIFARLLDRNVISIR
jgi:hypothetical protein